MNTDVLDSGHCGRECVPRPFRLLHYGWRAAPAR
jgi:hypothetical protein